MCAPGPEARGRSSARAHLAGQDDGLVQAAPLLRRIPNWARFLAGGGLADQEITQIRKHSRTSRLLGTKRFVERLERSRGANRRRQIRTMGMGILSPELRNWLPN